MIKKCLIYPEYGRKGGRLRAKNLTPPPSQHAQDHRVFQGHLLTFDLHLCKEADLGQIGVRGVQFVLGAVQAEKLRPVIGVGTALSL